MTHILHKPVLCRNDSPIVEIMLRVVNVWKRRLVLYLQQHFFEFGLHEDVRQKVMAKEPLEHMNLVTCHATK